MDKADAARRVRLLRALGVDPHTTASERAAANAKADKLEAKYGKAEPPSVYVSEPTTYAGGRRVYEHPWSTPDVTIYVVHRGDLDDIVEEGYLWAPSDRDDY